MADENATPLSPADIQALRERYADASPGEWHAYRVQDEWLVRHGDENVILRTHSSSTQAEANVAFIAAAHNALPGLLATIETQAARLAELERGKAKS